MKAGPDYLKRRRPMLKKLIHSSYISLIVTISMICIYEIGLFAVFFSNIPLLLMTIIFDLPVLAIPGVILSIKQLSQRKNKVPSIVAAILNFSWFCFFIHLVNK